MKVYGPYTRPDGRKHIVIVNDNGSRTTKSYPKFIMEQHLGRELIGDETVDHIDEDFNNDSLENLQILTRSQNARKSLALRPPAEVMEFICPYCGTSFVKSMRDYRGNQLAQGKKGPYCGKSCAGKATYVNHWK